jgi:predicted MFS family arabinose efflux permease
LDVPPGLGPHPRDRAADNGFLGNRALALMAAACAASVANGYYIQPLLVEIGASLAMPERLLGLLPAMTQVGVAAGVLFLLPLADILSARRLLLAVIPAQMAALLLAAVSGRAITLMAACLLIGFAGITPYVLPPYASARVRPAELGRMTGLLTRGVIVGILLARTVSGVIGTYLCWRAVCVLALAVMLGVLLSLRRLVQPAAAGARDGPEGYRALLLSMVRLLRTVPALRAAAACQALSFGSFNVFWLGSSFYLQGPDFGWRPDAVGAVAVIGAIAASGAPFLGRAADIAGAHAARTLSFAAMALGLVMLDVGATVADIAGRTILYRLDPAIRARLNALYTVAMFAGGGILSSLVGPVWTTSGWLSLCGLGLIPILLAAVIAAADQRG